MISRTRDGHRTPGPARRREQIARAGLLIGAAAVLAAGCSGSPTPPTPAPTTPGPPVATVPLPAPSADGPVLTVQGQANWTTGHPGCAVLRTDNGQLFTLVGPATEQHLGEVRSGTSPDQQRVRITGYVPRVGASVCGAQRAFVAEKVTTMDR